MSSKTMIGDVLGLILSIIVAGAMIWGCSFDTQEIVIGPLAQFSAGKYQFLTIINLYLQAIYYSLCVINFFFGSNTLLLEKRSLLQKLRDFIFAGVAFPPAMFVCIVFWSLYRIDRNLIHAEELNQIISPTLNHVMHTLPGVAICFENLVHCHCYPSRLRGLLCILIISGAYIAWTHYLHHIYWLKFKTSVWTYPILNKLSFMHRQLFFVGIILFVVGLYLVGEMYTLCLITLRAKRLEQNKKTV